MRACVRARARAFVLCRATSFSRLRPARRTFKNCARSLRRAGIARVALFSGGCARGNGTAVSGAACLRAVCDAKAHLHCPKTRPRRARMHAVLTRTACAQMQQLRLVRVPSDHDSSAPRRILQPASRAAQRASLGVICFCVECTCFGNASESSKSRQTGACGAKIDMTSRIFEITTGILLLNKNTK
jgi:hypothetical protein